MTMNAGSRRFGPNSIVVKQEPKSVEKPVKIIMSQDETEEEEVDLNGFQVVRREFFAHTREPSIVFSDGKISVNTACVRKLPDAEYIQILINRETQQLAIRPCEELDLFAVQWGTTKNGKRFPRAVTGRIFFMKICDMMEWDPNHRYKILGRLSRANGDHLFVFDLKSFETYERSVSKTDGKRKSSRIPIFPMEWKDQFGIPFEKQHQALQINMFDGFTLFSLKDNMNAEKSEEDKTENQDRKEE